MPVRRAHLSSQLPPLKRVRVKHPNAVEADPCTAIMSSMLGCWASAGQTSQACAKIEQALKSCMDAKKPAAKKTNTINYHLSRLYPKIVGPRKRS